MALSVLTLIFNVTYLDFNNLFAGDSQIAIIGILASACVLVIILILLTSKAIEKKYRESDRG